MTASIVRAVLILCSLGVLTVSAQAPAPGVKVVKAHPYLTKNNTGFGSNIEGASVDQFGNVYAVDWESQNTPYTFGQIYPKQQLVYTNPSHTSAYNGIRWVRPSNHNITRQALLVDNNAGIARLSIYKDSHTTYETVCTNPKLSKPNDLALGSNGGIFISQQIYNEKTVIGDGGVWYCHQNDTNASAVQLWIGGRTNGIEVSPDNKTLYVSEAFNCADYTPCSNVVWRFDIVPGKPHPTLANKTLFVDFAKLDNTASVDVDGSRTDINGNLYVSRNGGGGVYKFNPAGKPLLYIQTNTKNPANLEFGGSDGKTMFIVGYCVDVSDKGCVDKLQVSVAGKAWTRLQG